MTAPATVLPPRQRERKPLIGHEESQPFEFGSCGIGRLAQLESVLTAGKTALAGGEQWRSSGLENRATGNGKGSIPSPAAKLVLWVNWLNHRTVNPTRKHSGSSPDNTTKSSP